ncbi:MAG: hypothetical protein ACYTGX_19370 [Planctomycetota bacterium]|jgi:hypothetical protein
MDAPISDEVLSIMLSSAVDTLDDLQDEAFRLAVEREWAPTELVHNAEVLLAALQAGEPIAQVRVLARDTRARIPAARLDPDSAL